MVTSKKMNSKGHWPGMLALEVKQKMLMLMKQKMLKELSPALTLPPGAGFQAVMASVRLAVLAVFLYFILQEFRFEMCSLEEATMNDCFDL